MALLDDQQHLFPYQRYAMGPVNKALVSITSILSMLGSLVIILSYIAWKDIRTSSRNVLIWLSVSDFIIALSNICGTYFKPTFPENMDTKCIIQSFVMSSSSISSFCWSATLAYCLFLTIIKNEHLLFQSFIPYFHIFNWSFGLIINLVAVYLNKLGNSADEVTAGWCWIRHHHINKSTQHDIRDSSNNEIMWMLLNYKAIEVIAYAVIFFIYMLIKFNLKKEVKFRVKNVKNGTSDVVLKIARSADRKLIIIPILLILARLPGTIRFFLFADDKMPQTPTAWSKALLNLQGVGDSAQGLLNCIFFCFLQVKVRNHLKNAFLWFICGCCWSSEMSSRHDNDFVANVETSLLTNSKSPLIDKNRLVRKYDG